MTTTLSPPPADPLRRGDEAAAPRTLVDVLTATAQARPWRTVPLEEPRHDVGAGAGARRAEAVDLHPNRQGVANGPIGGDRHSPSSAVGDVVEPRRAGRGC